MTGYYNLRDIELASANPRSDNDWFRKEMTEDKNKRRLLIPYRRVAVGDTVTFTVLADTAASAEINVQAFAGGVPLNVEEMTYERFLERQKEYRATLIWTLASCAILILVSCILGLHRRLRRLETHQVDHGSNEDQRTQTPPSHELNCKPS